MWTAIIDKKTKEILHVYRSAPLDKRQWIEKFDYTLADPNVVEHIEVPDSLGDDYTLNSKTLKWELITL